MYKIRAKNRVFGPKIPDWGVSPPPPLNGKLYCQKTLSRIGGGESAKRAKNVAKEKFHQKQVFWTQNASFSPFSDHFMAEILAIFHYGGGTPPISAKDFLTK